MAETRTVGTQVDTIASLRRDLDDFKSTMALRANRSATGDIEPTIRTVAKTDTLLMQGQVVNRADYPILWQWVQDQSLIVAGLFTVGDGSLTFGIPDFRGRVPIGAGAFGSDTYVLGATVGATLATLALANLPAHNHSVGVADHSSHSHSGSSATAGSHGSHFPGSQFNAPNGPDLGLAAWNSGGSSGGSHSHSVTVNSANVSSHSVSESSVGSGTPLDVRQASIAVNWLVWT